MANLPCGPKIYILSSLHSVQETQAYIGQANAVSK